MQNHKLKIVRIEKVVKEASNIRSIFFKDNEAVKSKPGQFIMLWVPNKNEMPMSISSVSEDLVGITVKPVGKGTNALFKMKKGDLIGVRGPYGNYFTITKKKSLLIGGGVGLAPLIFLAEKMKNCNITFILAGKSKDEIPFTRRVKELEKEGHKIIFVTEDGSLGVKGIASDFAKKIIKEEKFEFVYACGPEIMIKKIYDFVKRKDLKFEASLERYMKCGFGICGSCAIGSYLVCKDGPVFNKKMISDVEDEFGKFTRDCSGKKVRVK